MTTRPNYHFHLSLVVPRIPSFLVGRSRALTADVAAAFAAIHTAPRVIAADHIPQRDAFLLVMNHYHRHDIPAWWSGMAVIHAVAMRRAGHAPYELRMLIASQWTYDSPLQKKFVAPLGHFAIGRIARAYNFLTIVPTALGDAHAGERASAIRRVIEVARSAVRENVPLGMAPEGGDSADGALMRPPTGTGRFMLLLAATGLRFLPVGIWAEDDVLVTRFGEIFELKA